MNVRELNPYLQRISDTEILLNFKDALEKIYPNLIKIDAHGYDEYDDIVENLFHSMVYEIFADKYGEFANKDEYLGYEFTPQSNEKVSKVHIQIQPKRLPFTIYNLGQKVNLPTESIKDNLLLFLNFGDTIHSITSGPSQEEASNINFRFSRFLFLNEKCKVINDQVYWVLNDDVDYHCVFTK